MLNPFAASHSPAMLPVPRGSGKDWSLASVFPRTCSGVAHLLLPFQATSSSRGSSGMLLPARSAGLT